MLLLTEMLTETIIIIISRSEQWSANQRNPSCGILASAEVVMGIICEFI